MAPMELHADDKLSRELQEIRRPRDWVNPDPGERYDLVVIGSGSAGLILARDAAKGGARVALAERGLLGGDCGLVGCIPSKALLASSRVAAAVHGAGPYGVNIDGVTVDFPAVMQRVRRIRYEIERHGSPAGLRDAGVDVFFGEASFDSPESIRVGDALLRFENACIATGTRPTVPPVEGLTETGFLTNETVFSLTDRPRRLAVIGAGPIGCELGQAFARLGCVVTIVEMADRILPREIPGASDVLSDALESDGVRLLTGAKVTAVSPDEGAKTIHYELDGRDRALQADEILLAVGRTPNVEALNLEAAGLAPGEREGVDVDDFLRTARPNIYAAGDVCLPYKFTHMANRCAEIVLANALHDGERKLSDEAIPWCTYTDPEVAHVCLCGWDASKPMSGAREVVFELTRSPRAIAEGRSEGFLALCADGPDGRIRAATLVAPHAGESIGEITLAVRSALTPDDLAGTIHCFPTVAEAIGDAAGQF